jgi:predicted permease
MRALRVLWLRLCGTFRKPTEDTEFAQELESNLAMDIEDGVRRGLTQAEARRQALIHLGGIEQATIARREAGRLRLLDELAQDIAYGARVLRKNPGFTLLAVLTLALGIGANTALFSIVNGVLLNPLPYPHPNELVSVHASKPNFDQGAISYPNFRDWQKDNRSLAALAISRGSSASLTGSGEAERVRIQYVSSDFLPILGINPVLGRTLAAGEDEIGRGPIALLSAGLWQRKFASKPDVLGKVLTLDGRDVTIVGVLPASFNSSFSNFRASDLYLPIGQWQNPSLKNRGAPLGIHGIARLRPGVSLAHAQEDMNGVSDRLATQFPQEDHGIRAKLVPLRKTVVGAVQPLLLVLLGAVGFVLLIACVNVANLLLAKSSTREQEFAVRFALGASRMRIVRQLLTESAMLALAGGALGLALAAWGTRAALALAPTTLPRASEVHLSATVLWFTLLISLGSGILFGLLPALKISRQRVNDALKEGGRGINSSRHQGQNALVVLEMALALVLLTGAGLMMRSLVELSRVNAGFDPHSVLTLSLAPPPSLNNANADGVREYIRELDRKLAQTPGVAAQSLSVGAFPMNGDDERLFWMDGEAKPANNNSMHWALGYVVGPDYLRTMGIPLKRGRFFAPTDDEHAERVVVIDEKFAEKFYPGQDPIGKHLNLDDFEAKATIIGVVGHVIQWGLDRDASNPLRAEIYESIRQLPDDALANPASGVDVILRSVSGDALAPLKPVRDAMKQMNTDQVLYGQQTMDQIIADSLAARRFSMILLEVFAALALVLASVGMYGVISYLVSQRTHDIGLRMALGANRSDVLRWVLGQGGRLALTGAAVGLVASVVLMRVMARLSMSFGLGAWDPWTLAGVTALLMAVAGAACYVPASRAMRIDPLRALRSE